MPDKEGYRQILTQAANHLLLPDHSGDDMHYVINSRWDAQSNINASRERRHESKLRRQEEYD
jgi:hypothetical protein